MADDDDQQELDDDEELEEEELDDDADDDDGDDDEPDDTDDLTDEERTEYEAELKRLNRDASRMRRALKAGKRPKRRADPEASVAAREARVAVKELLADNGLPTSAAKLVDLAQLELDQGELADPDDVLDWVRQELEDLGVSLGGDDDDRPPPRKKAAAKKRSSRKLPKDKGGSDAQSNMTVGERLAAQVQG